MENELKYIYEGNNFLDSANLFMELLKENGFIVRESQTKEQVDYYYDTNTYTLLQLHESLRIREKQNGFKGTYKRLANHNQAYLVREEIEVPLTKRDITFVVAFLQKKNISIPQNLNLVLYVYNHRNDVIIEKEGVCFCVSFDQVTYYPELFEKSTQENMIEIEAKDKNYESMIEEIHGLCQMFSDFILNKESKYERGMHLKLEKNQSQQTLKLIK